MEPVAAAHARFGLAHARAAVGLGAKLARQGAMPIVSLVVSAISVLGLCALGIAYARRGTEAPVRDVPILASEVLAWGGGFLHVSSTAIGAFVRDRPLGIRHLFQARTRTVESYVVARVGGVVVWLLLAVAGGTLVVGVVTLLVSSRPETVVGTLRATIASIAYGAGFAVVLPSIAFAAAGARQRGGYLTLLGLILVPELIATAAAAVLPPEVTELCALPSALVALRSSLGPDAIDVGRFLRAFVALALFTAIALVFVRRDVKLLEAEQEART